MQESWLPIFGPPRVLVADQAREFISHEFEAFCGEHGILLWHAGVQAPWQNGVCERGGGILKCLVTTLVKKHSIVDFDEMSLAVQEAVTAYNHDVNELGVSPAQAALGKQPRMTGDVLGGFHNRLSEHGLVDSVPHLSRRIALRETAKVAMLRLHFSRAIRRGESPLTNLYADHGIGTRQHCLFLERASTIPRVESPRRNFSFVDGMVLRYWLQLKVMQMPI